MILRRPGHHYKMDKSTQGLPRHPLGAGLGLGSRDKLAVSGVNRPKHCEMSYSHLRQRAFTDSSGLVLHPGDVWEVPGYFHPSCSGAQGAAKRKRIFSCSQRWSEPDFADFSRTPQTFPVDNWHCFEVYGSYAKYLTRQF